MTLLAKDRNGADIQALGWGAVQNVAIGASSVLSSAIASAKVIRLAASVDCWVVVGSSPTASATTGVFMPAGSVEYVRADAGLKVAAIQSSGAGNLNITECA